MAESKTVIDRIKLNKYWGYVTVSAYIQALIFRKARALGSRIVGAPNWLGSFNWMPLLGYEIMFIYKLDVFMSIKIFIMCNNQLNYIKMLQIENTQVKIYIVPFNLVSKRKWGRVGFILRSRPQNFKVVLCFYR